MAGESTRKRGRTSPAASTNAVDIAMDAIAGGKTPDDVSRGLLLDQRRLIGWQTANERASFALRILTGAAGFAVAVAIAAMVWNASRAHGLVVEAFAVPPSLAARGDTGEVLAREFIDELSAISSANFGAAGSRSLEGQWANSLTVEIPNTGVSLGQVDRWLKEKLGDQKRVSGEVKILPDGQLALVVRAGADGFPAAVGAPGEMPALLKRQAEALYGRDNPRNFYAYLRLQGRHEENRVFAEGLTRSRTPFEQALGWNVLANESNDELFRIEGYRKAFAADPTFDPSVGNTGNMEEAQGRSENAVRLQKRQIAMARRYDTRSPEAHAQSMDVFHQTLALRSADYAEALRLAKAREGQPLLGFMNPTQGSALNMARILGGLHETGRAAALIQDYAPRDRTEINRLAGTRLLLDVENQDWDLLLRDAEGALALLATYPDKGVLNVRVPTMRALALAQLGRFAEAQAQIAQTPLDCEPCVVVRGQIAELAGQPKIADHWLGQAVKMAPSLPHATEEWGRVLLVRGDEAGAIEKFKLANKRQPNFADPLQGWGEALLAQGKAKAAVAKFREADKTAPNWGRNHLLWGEALAKVGKADEARDQWSKAGRLDLTPAERARLDRNLAGSKV